MFFKKKANTIQNLYSLSTVSDCPSVWHFGQYLHVSLDKPECYPAICKDIHRGKDQHYQTQVHSRAQLTWPGSTWNFSHTKSSTTNLSEWFQSRLTGLPLAFCLEETMVKMVTADWLGEFNNYFATDFSGFQIMLYAFWEEYYLQDLFCHFTQYSQTKLQKQLKYTQMFQ